MRRKPNNTNAKGRNKECRFTRLPHYLLESSAYRSLSTNARALLVEMTMLENGKNNGAFWLSVKDAGARMGLANLQSVSCAFNDLTEAGFIRMTRDGFFHVKASNAGRARCWRLTWLAWPGVRGPTNEWNEYDPPPKTRARSRMVAGHDALKRLRKIQAEGRSAIYDLHMLVAVSEPGGAPTVCDSYTVVAKDLEKTKESERIRNGHAYSCHGGSGDGLDLGHNTSPGRHSVVSRSR
jgi:hypothetical protein